MSVDRKELEKALSIVREKYKNVLVWNAFPFNCEWVFTITIGKQFSKDNITGTLVGVEPKSKNIKMYSFFTNFKGADNNLIWIDVDPKQLKET